MMGSMVEVADPILKCASNFTPGRKRGGDRKQRLPEATRNQKRKAYLCQVRNDQRLPKPSTYCDHNKELAGSRSTKDRIVQMYSGGRERCELEADS